MATGDILARRVFERVQRRLSPEQITRYLNLGINYVTLNATCPWDVGSATNAVPTAGDTYATFPNGIDVGKTISIFNHATTTPVVRTEQDEIGTKSAGYINTMPLQYNTFRIGWSLGNPFIDLYPKLGGAGAIDIYYSQPPVVLDNTSVTQPRWNIPALDDLIVDYAEGEIKRQFGAPDAQAILERCEMRIRALAPTFSTQKIMTGPDAEQAALRGAKNQQGIV